MLAVLAFAVAASATEWQQPPAEVMRVLHAPPLPWVWTDPTGEHMLLADPVTYPPLMEYAAGWHELAGTRVSPLHGGVHGRHGGTSPRLVAVDGGAELPLALPAGAEVHRVAWTVDGDRFARLPVAAGAVSGTGSAGPVGGGLDPVIEPGDLAAMHGLQVGIAYIVAGAAGVQCFASLDLARADAARG